MIDFLAPIVRRQLRKLLVWMREKEYFLCKKKAIEDKIRSRTYWRRRLSGTKSSMHLESVTYLFTSRFVVCASKKLINLLAFQMKTAKLVFFLFYLMASFIIVFVVVWRRIRAVLKRGKRDKFVHKKKYLYDFVNLCLPVTTYLSH